MSKNKLQYNLTNNIYNFYAQEVHTNYNNSINNNNKKNSFFFLKKEMKTFYLKI